MHLSWKAQHYLNAFKFHILIWLFPQVLNQVLHLHYETFTKVLRCYEIKPLSLILIQSRVTQLPKPWIVWEEYQLKNFKVEIVIPPRHYIVTPGKRENIILYIYNVAKVYSSKDSSSVSFFLWKVLTGKHVLHKRIYKFWFRKPQTLWNSSDTFETAHWDFSTKSAVKVGVDIHYLPLLTSHNFIKLYSLCTIY